MLIIWLDPGQMSATRRGSCLAQQVSGGGSVLDTSGGDVESPVSLIGGSERDRLANVVGLCEQLATCPRGTNPAPPGRRRSCLAVIDVRQGCRRISAATSAASQWLPAGGVRDLIDVVVSASHPSPPQFR